MPEAIGAAGMRAMVALGAGTSAGAVELAAASLVAGPSIR